MESPGRSFPIQQDVYYQARKRGGTAPIATGRTIYMSSHEVAFTTEGPLNIGDKIEMTVNWPVLINRTCRMKLVISGRVIKNELNTAAVKIERHEFRTRSANSPLVERVTSV